MSNTVQHITDDDFESSVLKSALPVLVDFWAQWCGPCKSIGPVLEDIALEYGDKITIAKLNIDDNPQIPQQYGIRSIPTLMIFKNGKVESTKTGALSKLELANFINQAL